MKKNGFIATSLIYSFFLAFVALVSVILATYSYYRTILNTLNKDILSGLNTEIQSKYITLENLIQNGSFEDSTNKWGSQVNVEIPAASENISAHGAKSLRLNTSNYTANSQVQQSVTVPTNIASISGKHQYYLRFRIFRNGNLVFSGGDAANAYANISVATNSKIGLGGAFTNWSLASMVIEGNAASSITVNFTANNSVLDHQGKTDTNEGGRALSVYIDDVMLIDVTELSSKLGISGTALKNRLDGTSCGATDWDCQNRKLEYFDSKYSYELD
ncbi:MAG TPA: hypothetical protein DHU33_02355 [Firmicutes bacterium]|mgnify:FL=1|nr:hypothetical protein [Bacillota bacterium]